MESLLDLDRLLLLKINQSWASPWLDALFITLTDFHKTSDFQAIVFPIAFIALLFLRSKAGLVTAFFLALSLGLSDFFSANLLKHFIERPRPLDAGIDVVVRTGFGGFSFPSGHATNISCLAVFMSLQFPKTKWFFIILALLVCYSRSYVGVHFPSDIVGGAFVGGLFGWAGAWTEAKTERKIFS